MIEYYDFMAARNTFGSSDPFGEACNKALSDAQKFSPQYDAILVDEDAWVAMEIKKNINEDELRPDDIIVINPDPLTTKRVVAGA